MRILFLTDNFPPEVNAPASRTFEHCREWVRLGHQVTVITCAPNFPKGRVFDGYRNRLFAREVMDGVEVVRVWTYISANEGFFRRTLDYVSFMVAATLAAPFVARPDIIVATSPQFFTALAGYLVSCLRRRPFVFELRDLWPESIRAVGAMRSGRLLDVLERLELFLYRRAAAIVSVTNAFKRNLVARGIDPAKISVVTNGADLSRFQPRPRDETHAARLRLQRRLVVGYVGTHGLAHALETVLQAASQLQDRADGANVTFMLLGDGAAKAGLKAQARAMGLRNVIFEDSVGKDMVVAYWSLIDLALIHLKHTELFTTVIPSKLFECMAMGIPVLHGVKGESAEIVEREGVGIAFEPEDADALAALVLRLAGDPDLRRRLGEAGQSAARRYDRQALAGEMLAVLAQVAAASERSRKS